MTSPSTLPPHWTTPYNVVWTTPSANSSESMPCGGGSIGLNVWVENGELLVYVSRSGTFDENNCMLKLGRVRLAVKGAPFGGEAFRQELVLRDGSVRIGCNDIELQLWVDVRRPVIHLTVQTAVASEIVASFESWRFEDRALAGKELWANSYKSPQPFEIRTRKDAIEFRGNSVLFCHRNSADGENIFDLTVRRQGMAAVKDQMFDPVTHRTFGGLMQGENLVAAGTSVGRYADADYMAWRLESAAPAAAHHVELALHVAQTATPDEWLQGLTAICDDAYLHRDTAREATQAWWEQFWERSRIILRCSDDARAWEAGRNYQLFRYMLACNAYGEFPTKFNGGLFTFDPAHVNPDLKFTPDFRRWGGGVMTAQNQRLVYFPLFRSGDLDMLTPQFDFYLRPLRNAELRSAVYWNHRGACFTEQIENFALPNMFEWGWKRPPDYDPGMEYNAWLEYQWDTVFEFGLMMLDTEAYEGRDIQAYLPLTESCLTFFDEHYRMLARKRGVKELNARGEYTIFPGSACETYKIAYNPSSTVAALRVILQRLLALPARYLDEARRGRWQTMLTRIPPVPLREVDGRTLIAPAVAWDRVQNVEAAQLYPVFPWGLYGVGRPDLQVARDTYFHDPDVQKFRGHESWKQYAIFAARLGLTEEAADFTLKKLGNGPHRFPAFWGPGFDWTPDHNWGGSGMIGLQEMLLQTDGDTIHFLPAWPKKWDVEFKLHAPGNTVVEAVVKAGKLETISVSPPARLNDITGLDAWR